jgi:hypothetical protein
MVVDRIGHRILGITLPVAVIVNYQIAGETHQPIREIALFRIVLVQCPIDAYENFLGQILGGIRARRKPVREIEDATRICRNDIFPRGAVTGAGTPHEFGTIDIGSSF